VSTDDQSVTGQVRRFVGRTAVVVGGASGIGRACAFRLLEEGADVSVLDVDLSTARDSSIADSSTDGRTYRVAQCDTTSFESVQDAIKSVVAATGRLDVAVHSAVVPPADDIGAMDVRELERDISIALVGSFNLVKACLPTMIAQRSGNFLFVSSVNALQFFGEEAYSSAKAGQLSLARSVATRYGRVGIRANAVVPGTIATPVWHQKMKERPDLMSILAKWYPLGRIGTTTDVANAVAFMASDDASWISGTSLVIDGGLTAGNLTMAREIAGNVE
jgi:meso-butanediol dehydrogenase/(S,S)-butanediol dehydrogenase/diacetyl reductase